MAYGVSQLTEEDVKHQFITPALHQRWKPEQIRMEYQITDGQVILKGNLHTRAKPKKADYVLFSSAADPLAIVEAKDQKHLPGYGIQQAKEYAAMLGVPFAYSSNGECFVEYNFLTGIERAISMNDFPGEEELLRRIRKESNDGKGLNGAEKKVMDTPWYASPTTWPPRYYQRQAVNQAAWHIAKGNKRLLLVMATGTGKTYVAFQLIYRLLKSGIVRKVLYLADRNILVDQSIKQDFSPLEKVIHKVNYEKDRYTRQTAHQVYFSLYHQLIGQNGSRHYAELFRPDFFDLIIVDECHRGSAKDDSQWREILNYFQDAVQLGMTATPKETKYISNLTYFGDPVYTYSLNQGIQDGFLAPFKVIRVTLNIGDGWRPVKGQTDAFGERIPDRVYMNQDYDYKIVLQDRIREVAHSISQYLKKTDPMAKTIVFCADEDHAERMRQALAEENPEEMKKNPDYVVRITGSDAYGKSKLDRFISVTEPYPVIATTSKLLSTGVDTKMVKLIVLDKWIQSMTEFKQIIGRGTRLKYEEGKTSFTIMDFRNVSSLFADPEWDGPVTVDSDFGGKGSPGSEDTSYPDSGSGGTANPGKGSGEGHVPYGKPLVRKDGCKVYTVNHIIAVYDTDGKLLQQENIIDYTKRNIRGEFASLDAFIRRWNGEEKKDVIRQLFKDWCIDLEQLKQDEHMEEVDDYDFICHLAYDQKPLTRKERAEAVKHGPFLSHYQGAAREVLSTLLDQYMNTSVYDIEQNKVLQLPVFQKYGTLGRIIKKTFGGKEEYEKAVRQLADELYQVV